MYPMHSTDDPVVHPITGPLVHPPGLAGPRSDGEVRFQLSPLSTRPGRGMNDSGLLDGAWWPRSRDLRVELPALVGALDPYWPRITRVSVNPAHWPDIPAKLPVGGRRLYVGWFTTQLDPNELLLLSYRSERWNLLVVPPLTPELDAVRLMDAAADPGNRLTVRALMARQGAGSDGPVGPASVSAAAA